MRIAPEIILTEEEHIKLTKLERSVLPRPDPSCVFYTRHPARSRRAFCAVILREGNPPIKAGPSEVEFSY